MNLKKDKDMMKDGRDLINLLAGKIKTDVNSLQKQLSKRKISEKSLGNDLTETNNKRSPKKQFTLPDLGSGLKSPAHPHGHNPFLSLKTKLLDKTPSPSMDNSSKLHDLIGNTFH